MDRFKKHRVKTEKPESSTSYRTAIDEYDLTYYIHDRVELMHQVFSVLKHKDIKAMAPECVRHISVDDLEELCTEELLGISSKRLCAVLDGAEPPSDTDSSSESPERLETISLDSISSDEEILSEVSSKKNKKHRHHRHGSKAKAKRTKKASAPEGGTEEQSRASRAGLTVLELLELQARARAIRAQLQQEQAAKQTLAASGTSRRSSERRSSDNEVEIKEEPPEVVEISSDDEKPDPRQLDPPRAEKESPPTLPPSNGEPITKRVSDLVITVPQARPSRRIKLNRRAPANTSSDSVGDVAETSKDDKAKKDSDKRSDRNDKDKVGNKQDKAKDKNSAKKDTEAKTVADTAKTVRSDDAKTAKAKEKQKKRQKKKDKKKTDDKDSDHDEITLQLSDTEKMDLLEDLDRKQFEVVSSSGSEDSESSSSDSSSDEEDDDETSEKAVPVLDKELSKNNGAKTVELNKSNESVEVVQETMKDLQVHESLNKEEKASDDVKKISDDAESAPNKETFKDDKIQKEITATSTETSQSNDVLVDVVTKSPENSEKNKEDEEKDSESSEESIDVVTIDDIPVVNDELSTLRTRQDSPIKEIATTSQESTVTEETSASLNRQNCPINEEVRRDSPENIKNRTGDGNEIDIENKSLEENTSEKEMSEGELSDKESSEIEAFDLKPEVVCISDTEETSKKKKKGDKKKKKKEKKGKAKKSKKSDFRVSGDQNFYEEPEQIEIEDEVKVENVVKIEETKVSLDDDDYDVCEILELSDDSSCYEVEGTTLSKEPTAEEIEALSAKIDEIEREDVVTEEDIKEHERKIEENSEDLENISWKDRYLDSKKVKRVLSTSNIFNALRKKNRELKKKLEESKKKEEEVMEAEKEKEIEIEIEKPLEEGSIEQYKTLQGLTKYVDPVQNPVQVSGEANAIENTGETQNGENKNEKNIVSGEVEQNGEITIEPPPMVKEMRKDAKQLLKMYEKLLKYNDINRSKQKDPNKKKKKSKKKKRDGSTVASSALQTV